MFKYGPVIYQCVLDTMYYYNQKDVHTMYYYNQKDVHLLYSCQEVVSMLSLSNVCVNIYCSIYQSLQPSSITFMQRRKTTGVESLFTWDAFCILNPLSPLMKGWTPPEFQGCCGLEKNLLTSTCICIITHCYSVFKFTFTAR